ncbi:DNA/RNA helicase domain-containing protein [Pseudomonas wadenswilerensis]
MSSKPLVEVNRYAFSRQALATDIGDNAYAAGAWPLVYILSDEARKQAYVGETTDTLNRMNVHLNTGGKNLLRSVHLISSERFNKSATLDIESSLIKYIAADGRFSLLNSNLGLVDHNYYQRHELYTEIFKETWNKLRGEGLVQHSLESIDNSDLFKYSPYKSLSSDQRQGLLGIMHALLDDNTRTLIVQGGAGTGKSVLAIYLFKLLHSDIDEMSLHEFDAEEAELRDLLIRMKQRFGQPRMALVVPMASFRITLKKAFRNIVGLRPDMVIGPAELARDNYDIVLVDEAHRLRKRTNLGPYFKKFDTTSKALGFDQHTCSEVDWVCRQAQKAVFFYDASQSIKPSDANAEDFSRLKALATTQVQVLLSQFRVRAGNPYVKFLDDLLNVRRHDQAAFSPKGYELTLFDSINDMMQVVQERNRQFGLSRMIAGYAWPWISQKNKDAFDIEIEGVKLRWNSTSNDWINTRDAATEVGCIHTTQGYDLNYAAIIFGNEIGFDKARGEITIDATRYFDRNGKSGIKQPEALKQYILNIYKTIMLRGIRGTFVYACNKDLHEYLAAHIPGHVRSQVHEPMTLAPYVNAVPLYDLQAAAGGFSELQKVAQKSWVAVSGDIPLDNTFYACEVVGESMNRVIPNGAVCLFRTERGGSRNGKIVLVELWDEAEGAHYTVKEYRSSKVEAESGWHHHDIQLVPRSSEAGFETITLKDDLLLKYRVVGEFVKVLESP